MRAVLRGLPGAILAASLTLCLPAAAQGAPQSALDEARQLGEQTKSISDQHAALQTARREADAAASAPINEMAQQRNLLNEELTAIRRIYNGDRTALAVIDGKATGASKALPADVSRAAQLRSEIESMNARIKAANEDLTALREQFNIDQNRLKQAQAQTDLAYRQLRTTYQGDADALAAIEEKYTNGKGELTRAQQQAEQAAKRAEQQAAQQALREKPARDAIATAEQTAGALLLGNGSFKPRNDFEQDVLEAALMARQIMSLQNDRLSADPIVAARITELDTAIGALNQKHAKTESKKNPFTTQWRTLAGIDQPDNLKALVKPVRELYEPVLKSKKEVEKQIKKQEAAAATAGFFGTLINLAILGAIGFGLYRFWKYRQGRHARAHAHMIGPAMAQFGATPQERQQRIDADFDKKTRSVSANIEHNMGSGYRMSCTLGRSLAAMSGRDREALRALLHLYNLGHINDHGFYYRYIALLFGEGKGQFSNTGSTVGYGDNMNQGMTTYLAPFTAESCVNDILQTLDKVAKKDAGHPVVKSLTGRLLSGGTGNLSDTAEFRSHAGSGDYGVVVGDDETTGETLRFYGEGSLITIAPPGSGKTQSHVFPTLLTWKGPAVILDVKGEIYEGTSKWRSENVGPVYKFSPLSPDDTHCYNPLTFVRTEADYIWGDARLLADMMIVPTNSNDPYWDNEARNVVTAAIAYVCYSNPPDKRPQQAVLDILYGGGAWTSMISGLKLAIDVRVMMNTATALEGINEKTLSSVLQTARSSLQSWADPRIERATARSDWSPLDLRSDLNPDATGSPTIYICLKPSEIESYIPVLRVFIAQHIRMLSSQLPGKDLKPILFLLDELPRLRTMPPVEEALEVGRQYGIKLWMFAQSVGQMQNAYPNGDGMIGSCAVRMYMNPSLQDGTAQKLSEDIGMQDSVLDGTRSRIVEPNVLAGAEYKDYVIVMAAGTRPTRVRKHYAYKDEELKARMGSLPKKG